jgi:hypothetical protein
MSGKAKNGDGNPPTGSFDRDPATLETQSPARQRLSGQGNANPPVAHTQILEQNLGG